MSTKTPLYILIGADILFVVFFLVLLFFGKGQYTGLIACACLIAYLTYSVNKLRAQLKKP